MRSRSSSVLVLHILFALAVGWAGGAGFEAGGRGLCGAVAAFEEGGDGW